MLDLSIQDLVAVTGGVLELSDMPPLGGIHESIKRIVFDVRKVRPGWVYWAGANEKPEHAAAAFHRSALGVVGSRSVPPWAGSFHLNVRDAAESLEKVAAHLRTQLPGPLVAVLGDDAPDALYEAIYAVLDARAEGEFVAVRTPADVARALVELPARPRTAIVQIALEEIFQTEAILRLCRPDVVVISSAALSNHTGCGGRDTKFEPADEATLQAVVFAAAEQLGRSPKESAERWRAWRNNEFVTEDNDCRGGRQCAVRRKVA